MIVSASCRTDIPAFYTPWLLNRLKAGYIDVRNPFYSHSVSRIDLSDVDAWMFCTKNSIPLLPYLDLFKKPILMDVTITPYHRDLEPNVPDKKDVIAAMKTMAKKLGRDHLCVRYDPILLNERYDADYHLRAFEKLCTQLEGSVEAITISFLDDYKNVRKNWDQIRAKELDEKDLQVIGEGFAAIAKAHDIAIFTCNEKDILAPYGIPAGACFSKEKALKMTGKVFKKWKARDCGCVEMADIGVYNSCMHLCRYCYANYDEKQIGANYRNHDPESSLLIGHLCEKDTIIPRRDHKKIDQLTLF